MKVTDPDQIVPEGLATDEFVLRPITVDDAAADYAAVMDSREDLRRWSQSDWPADDFTLEANRKDLLDMANRRAAGKAYDWTVVEPSGQICLGCVYVFGPEVSFIAKGEVTALADQSWRDVEALVYFWVRSAQRDDELDARLLAALRSWFAVQWGIERVLFVTSEPFTEQLALFERAGLTPRFEIREPHKARPDLAFG